MDINKLTAMANRLSIPQLQQAMRDGSLPAYVGMPLLQQKVQESKQLQAAQAAGRPQAPTVASQVEGEADQHELMKRQALAMQNQMAGTGGISDMLRKPEAMAKGGAVAFAAGGDVGAIYEKLAKGEPLTDEEKQALAGKPVNPSTITFPKYKPLFPSDPQQYTGPVPAINQQRGTLNVPAPAAVQTPITPAQSAVASNLVGDVLGASSVSPLSRYTPPAQPIAAPQVQPQTQPAIGGIAPLIQSAPNSAQPQAQEVAEATPQADKSRSTADYVNELKGVLGEGKSNAALKDFLEQQGKDYAESKDKAPWMALMQAGLATMAGTSPFALANIGAGAQTGLKSYMDDMKDLRKEQDKARELQIKAAQLQDEKDLAIAKFGVESKHSDDIQARQDRNTDKQIASHEKIAQMQNDISRAQLDISRTTAGRPNEGTFQKEMFDALVAKGVSKDEAAKQVLAAGHAYGSAANTDLHVLTSLVNELKIETAKKVFGPAAAARDARVADLQKQIAAARANLSGQGIPDPTITPPPAPTNKPFDYSAADAIVGIGR